MKTEKIKLEFQAYEIEHILKALEFVNKGIKDKYVGSNDIWHYTNGDQKRNKYLSQIAFILKSIERQTHPKCRIYGSEIAFELFVPEKDLEEKVANIWDNPSNYWDVKNLSDDAYYSFIKFLWIDFPNGETVMLADYANDNNII